MGKYAFPAAGSTHWVTPRRAPLGDATPAIRRSEEQCGDALRQSGQQSATIDGNNEGGTTGKTDAKIAIQIGGEEFHCSGLSFEATRWLREAVLQPP